MYLVVSIRPSELVTISAQAFVCLSVIRKRLVRQHAFLCFYEERCFVAQNTVEKFIFASRKFCENARFPKSFPFYACEFSEPQICTNSMLRLITILQ